MILNVWDALLNDQEKILNVQDAILNVQEKILNHQERILIDVEEFYNVEETFHSVEKTVIAGRYFAPPVNFTMSFDSASCDGRCRRQHPVSAGILLDGQVVVEPGAGAFLAGLGASAW